MKRPQKLCVCTQCLSFLSAACPRTERQDSLGKIHTGCRVFFFMALSGKHIGHQEGQRS